TRVRGSGPVLGPRRRSGSGSRGRGRLRRGVRALAADLEHYLAEFAAGLEAFVGGRGPLELKGGGNRNLQSPRLEQRQNRAFERPGGERLLLEGTRTQRRAEDAHALGHEQSEIELALGAGADSDHDDSALGGEGRQVVREVGGADQFQDHVKWAVLGEIAGRDGSRTQLLHRRAQIIASYRRRNPCAGRPRKLDGRRADPSGATVDEQPFTAP